MSQEERMSLAPILSEYLLPRADTALVANKVENESGETVGEKRRAPAETSDSDANADASTATTSSRTNGGFGKRSKAARKKAKANQKDGDGPTRLCSQAARGEQCERAEGKCRFSHDID